MSASAIIQSAIRSTVAFLATPGIQYRAGKSGSWTDLPSPGGIFHAGPVQVVGYDESHNVIMGPMTAKLKVPDNLGLSLLVTAPATEWQIRQSDGTNWAIVGTSRHLGQTFYALSRIVPTSIGQPRGAV